MDPRINQLILHLTLNVQHHLSTNAMAHLVNLSASHLAHLFKREACISPQQFFKLVRMQHARLLLENSFLSVKQIMVLCGFNDASHFVRDFEKIYGQSPSQYRKRREENRGSRS